MMGVEKNYMTFDDIAKALGMSKTTVSRAISGKGRISEATRQRVLEFVQENNYRPNTIAQCLANRRTYNIGMSLPIEQGQNNIPFYQYCMQGLMEEAHGKEYDVLVFAVSEFDISSMVHMLEKRKVDGVVLTRTFAHDIAIDYLRKAGIPFVVTGSCSDDAVIQVDSNHKAASKELTSLLLMRGHKRIAYLGRNKELVVNQFRYEGFLEGYQAYDMDGESQLIYRNISTRAAINRAVDECLSEKVDCILCEDDVIGSKVLWRLQELDVAIPQQMCLAALHDSQYLLNPKAPITAIDFDMAAYGREAGKRLIELIETGTTKQKTEISYDILLKESTRNL